ncbi:MAG: DHH family phosphoesterase [Flavobacterium sp.]|nr:MAG: DHH family phosphoesterase [Flavobacterium sp.]
MNSEEISVIKKLLNTVKKIVVVGHKNPDGDAIGSCLGLSNFLRQLGHQVTTVMPNDFPVFLKWIPEASEIINLEQDSQKTISAINEADLIFTLDFNALHRTGDLEEYLEKATADFILIDHHQKPDDYAVVIYSDVAMCSTSEMVFHFMEYLDRINFLNKEIATQLYVGIMTDTGSFRYPATTATTHRVIANLIEAGAKNSTIHQNVYDTNSPDRLKLLGVALNNMVMLPEYKTAYITISQEELNENNFKKGDTEGFVNYALSMTGVVFAAIFIENKKEDIVKISLRSKGSFSVNDFSRNHFNGGGHINAAGGRSLTSLNQTVTNFISLLPDYKSALNES